MQGAGHSREWVARVPTGLKRGPLERLSQSYS